MKLILETEPTRQLSNGGGTNFFPEAIKKEKKKKNTTKVLDHYDDFNEDSPHWLIDLI